MRGDRSGFTLIEITIALAVLGLAVVSSLPFLQGWKDATDLRNSAAKVSNVMLSARMKAVVDRAYYTVSVDYTADGLSSAPPVDSAGKKKSVDLYLDDSDPDCPPLSAANVVFRPNGTADAAGFEAVYLRSRSARVPTRYRVKVLGATGKISVEKWTGGDWVGAY